MATDWQIPKSRCEIDCLCMCVGGGRYIALTVRQAYESLYMFSPMHTAPDVFLTLTHIIQTLKMIKVAILPSYIFVGREVYYCYYFIFYIMIY